MPDLHDAQIRSALISERIRQRTDIALREQISEFDEELSFRPLDEFMISEQAWRYIESCGIDPKFVFAHPERCARFQRRPNTIGGSRYFHKSASLTLPFPWRLGSRAPARLLSGRLGATKLHDSTTL